MNFKHTLLLFTALCVTGSAKADYSQFKDFISEETYNQGAFLGEKRDAFFVAVNDLLLQIVALRIRKKFIYPYFVEKKFMSLVNGNNEFDFEKINLTFYEFIRSFYNDSPDSSPAENFFRKYLPELEKFSNKEEVHHYIIHVSKRLTRDLKLLVFVGENSKSEDDFLLNFARIETENTATLRRELIEYKAKEKQLFEESILNLRDDINDFIKAANIYLEMNANLKKIDEEIAVFAEKIKIKEGDFPLKELNIEKMNYLLEKRKQMKKKVDDAAQQALSHRKEDNR